MTISKRKSTIYIFLTGLLLLILIEPSVAEDSEFDNINWLELFREFLNLFARILEHAANIARDGADLLVELFNESEE